MGLPLISPFYCFCLLLLTPSLGAVGVNKEGVSAQRYERGDTEEQYPSTFHQHTPVQPPTPAHPHPTTDKPSSHNLMLAEDDSWTILVKGLTRIVTQLMEPYMTLTSDLPKAWHTTVGSFTNLLQRSFFGSSPYQAAALSVVAISVPFVVQGARWVLEGAADLLEETVYATTGGHGLGRQALQEDLTHDLTDLLLHFLRLLSRYLGN